jgi:hypothetical protein
MTIYRTAATISMHSSELSKPNIFSSIFARRLLLNWKVAEVRRREA